LILTIFQVKISKRESEQEQPKYIVIGTPVPYRCLVSNQYGKAPLSVGGVTGQPHNNQWWCHDICPPLLAAEHSLFMARWCGTLCPMTSAYSRTVSFKQGLKTWLFSGY